MKGTKHQGEKHEHAQNIKQKVDSLMYKGLLMFFFFRGLTGVLHAGASLLGIAEGAATTVKGVELSSAAAEVAAIAKTAKAVASVV
jgi:hypothetical protein